jgi:flagellar biosynthesis/type III secretory pathway protein FliH
MVSLVEEQEGGRRCRRMRVTTTELHELIRLLEIHPEWRAELRRILLTEELLDLPKVVKELAEAQRRTEEALTNLTERMEKGFAEAAEDRKRIWEAMKKGFMEAAEDRRKIWETIETLAKRMDMVYEDVARLKGISLELRYARRAPAIFGRVITRSRDLTSRLANTLHKACQEKRISERDVESVLATDIL